MASVILAPAALREEEVHPDVPPLQHRRPPRLGPGGELEASAAEGGEEEPKALPVEHREVHVPRRLLQALQDEDQAAQRVALNPLREQAAGLCESLRDPRQRRGPA
jgi:hypothetical protein